MKKYRLIGIVTIVLSLLATACGAGGGSTGGAATPAAANTLTAVKTDSVALDGAASFWANAPKLDVATKSTKKDGPAGPTVTLQAAYDSKNLALRLEWADTTNSNLNKAWVWDGSKFTRSADLGDRMGVLFPIENNPEFASKGCAGACHNTDADQEKWWMGTDKADLRLDLWQWTAASSNPVGQAQDEWMSAQEDPTNMESGTHSDALTSGGSLSNVNKAKDGPAFMGTDLASSFIITGQQVPIDTSKLSKGAVIPPSVLAPWVGSRGDVQAKGVWQDGKWVVVLMRALNTGHDDDLVLTPPKSYPLGVAVFDHIDLVGHTTTPEAITLTWK
jgi:hypothetical protein